MKRCIERVMRKIIGEPAWVALKTRIRKLLPKSKKLNSEPQDDFARRIYARMALLESKANLLLYGAPAKDDFTLRVLQTRDLDTDVIAADFFARYKASAILEKRQRHRKQIEILASEMAKATVRRVLDLSNGGIFDQAFVKDLFPQSEQFTGEIPTDPVTAVQVLAEKQFDLMFCIGTLETLPPREQVQLLIRLVPLLAPNGTLFLHLPNLRNPEVLADNLWENPDILRPFSLSLLEFLFEDQQLQVTQYIWDGTNLLDAKMKVPTSATEITYLVRKK